MNDAPITYMVESTVSDRRDCVRYGECLDAFVQLRRHGRDTHARCPADCAYHAPPPRHVPDLSSGHSIWDKLPTSV